MVTLVEVYFIQQWPSQYQCWVEGRTDGYPYHISVGSSLQPSVILILLLPIQFLNLSWYHSITAGWGIGSDSRRVPCIIADCPCQTYFQQWWWVSEVVMTAGSRVVTPLQDVEAPSISPTLRTRHAHSSSCVPPRGGCFCLGLVVSDSDTCHLPPQVNRRQTIAFVGTWLHPKGSDDYLQREAFRALKGI